MLVLTPGGSVSDFMLYSMGLRDHAELESMVRAFANEEAVNAPSDSLSFSYDDLMSVTFKLVNAADFYQRDNEYGVWKDKSSDDAYMRNLVDNGETLKIAGVVKPKEGAKIASLQTGLYYPSSLVNHLIDQAGNTQIVQDQKANPATNVITGKSFADEESNQKNGNGFDRWLLRSPSTGEAAERLTFDEKGAGRGAAGSRSGRQHGFVGYEPGSFQLACLRCILHQHRPERHRREQAEP